MPRSGRNKPVVWADRAKQDLERIFDYIAENFSVALATERVGLILDEVETLSEFPRKGNISTRFNEIRELTVEGNTVYYRNNEDDVVVAAVRPRKTAPKKNLK
jgi:plasmid stabilization system protein ParE